jgi:hypothetical protein
MSFTGSTHWARRPDPAKLMLAAPYDTNAFARRLPSLAGPAAWSEEKA